MHELLAGKDPNRKMCSETTLGWRCAHGAIWNAKDVLALAEGDVDFFPLRSTGFNCTSKIKGFFPTSEKQESLSAILNAFDFCRLPSWIMQFLLVFIICN